MFIIDAIRELRFVWQFGLEYLAVRRIRFASFDRR
jgi:hypothetical protein